MNERQPDLSHLFTLRVWIEDLGENKSELRGRIQHVLTGQSRYFRDWSSVRDFLLALLDMPIDQHHAGMDKQTPSDDDRASQGGHSAERRH